LGAENCKKSEKRQNFGKKLKICPHHETDVFGFFKGLPTFFLQKIPEQGAFSCPNPSGAKKGAHGHQNGQKMAK